MSTTTPKKGGLDDDPERVFDRKLFTAEARRARRLLFYCFPLRGRKTIITSLMGYNHLSPIYVIILFKKMFLGSCMVMRLIFRGFSIANRKTAIANTIYTQLLSYLSLWRRSFLFCPLSRKEKTFSLPPGRRTYRPEAANFAPAP